MSARLAKARRIVVKIGSSTLITSDSGHIDQAWLEAMAEDIARLRRRGQDVVVVSSGAIALGRKTLGLPPGPLRLEESQAMAAVGQIALGSAWTAALAPHGLTMAQILLTLPDTEERRRYLNARSTLSTLLRLGVIPVINENDTVATTEIRYGDNDRLAARVASMAGADCLVLLSDVDGLYTADPLTTPSARRLARVDTLTPEIEAMASDAGSGLSRGGMKTKIAAARIALDAGCAMVIAHGGRAHPLRALEEHAPCTWFETNRTPVTARKAWIAGSLAAAGVLTVDAGAARALRQGKSLLPSGVSAVSGEFDRGDAVLIHSQAGAELGRGLVAYAAADARRIAGRKSGEIESLLGYRGRDEIVHRDDLVLKDT